MEKNVKGDEIKMKKWLILLFSILCLVGCESKTKTSNSNLVSSDEVKKMLEQNNVTIIDVRTAEEYGSKHIKGSINIPVDDIESEISQFVSKKDANIVVYCQSGNRSSLAKAKLKSLGYTKVYDLGSINNWTYDFE